MSKNKKAGRQTEDKRSIRDRIKDAAGNLKERAMNMNNEAENKQEAQSQQAQDDQQAEPIQVEEKPSLLDTLSAELEKVKAQCDEYLDLAQRKQAEFANYRRRTEGIRQEALDDGRRETIEKLLPVVDNLERAIQAAGEEESALRSGVEMVLRQTVETFTKMGVEEINPQGEPFDAELMNAVMQGSAEEGEPGTVCMVMQKGYKLGNRVIRHAMVKVVAG